VKFEKGNTIGTGRPKGARNKLDSYAYATALAHVQHKRGDPAPAEYEKTSLWIALDTTLKTQPREYLRAVISMLPKEVAFEHTVNRVTEIDLIIQKIEEQLSLTEQREVPLMIEHEHVRQQ